MTSRDEANRFVNCVMNRYKSDTVMSAGFSTLVVFSGLLAILLGTLIFQFKDGNYDRPKEILAYVGVILTFYISAMAMYMIFRRLVDHSARDCEWRESLINYARSYGCNTGKLEELDQKSRNIERTAAEKPAIIFLLVYFVAIMIIAGNPHLFNFDPNKNIYLIVLIIVGVLIAIFVSLTVFVYVLRFPYKHEKIQIEFTEELRALLMTRGIEIESMRSSIKKRRPMIAIILMIITAWLYTIVVLPRVYTDANNHIRNQWSYESRLMKKIITAEGGTGIAEGKEESR